MEEGHPSGAHLTFPGLQSPPRLKTDSPAPDSGGRRHIYRKYAGSHSEVPHAKVCPVLSSTSRRMWRLAPPLSIRPLPIATHPHSRICYKPRPLAPLCTLENTGLLLEKQAPPLPEIDPAHIRIPRLCSRPFGLSPSSPASFLSTWTINLAHLSTEATPVLRYRSGGFVPLSKLQFLLESWGIAPSTVALSLTFFSASVSPFMSGFSVDHSV